uniref:Uncharacterized protein n=1 Tax=Aegilops tauschii subsp. strangulata TaxID=200361 RepID=A0A453HC67_AEGTS
HLVCWFSCLMCEVMLIITFLLFNLLGLDCQLCRSQNKLNEAPESNTRPTRREDTEDRTIPAESFQFFILLCSKCKHPL